MAEAATARAATDDLDDDEGAPRTVFQQVKVEYRRPWLYPKQLGAIFDPRDHDGNPARIACVEASTKAGKTVSCIAWLVEQAMLGGGEGKNYWWVAPVAGQADIAFTRLLRFLPRESYTANRTLKTVLLLNGAIIWFKSGDRPDTLYGDDVMAAVVDEASRLKADAWHAVRSTLTYTRGPARLIGNVRGRKNWFYGLARRAEQGEAGLAYSKIIAHDAVEAGVLSADEIEEARRTYPERVFRELYLAEPSDDGGNPFGLSAIAGCVVSGMSDKPARAWGWDLAKSVDWTVGIALDEDRRVCRYERFQMPWGETKRRITLATNRVPALVDSTGVGDPVLEDLQRAVDGHGAGPHFEGYHFSPSSKQKLMEGLAADIQQKAIGYPPGQIVFELEQFEYTYSASGVRYSAPDGFNDDCVCALALAAMHLHRTPTPLAISQRTLTRAAMPGITRAALMRAGRRL